MWLAQDNNWKEKQFLKIGKQMVRDRQYVKGSSCVKDEDGIIVTDSDGVKEVWGKYKTKLLNVENVWDGEVE